jgi:hypothetical protein
MQRPRLTERTAEALETSLPILRAGMQRIDFATVTGMMELRECRRTISYLEDLLRWHRIKQSECDPNP